MSHNKNVNYEYVLHIEDINSRNAKARVFQVQTDWFPGAGTRSPRSLLGSGGGCCSWAGGSCSGVTLEWRALLFAWPCARRSPLCFSFPLQPVPYTISIISEPLRLRSKCGVFPPPYKTQSPCCMSCWRWTGHSLHLSKIMDLGHCKIQKAFPNCFCYSEFF